MGVRGQSREMIQGGQLLVGRSRVLDRGQAVRKARGGAKGRDLEGGVPILPFVPLLPMTCACRSCAVSNSVAECMCTRACTLPLEL